MTVTWHHGNKSSDELHAAQCHVQMFDCQYCMNRCAELAEDPTWGNACTLLRKFPPNVPQVCKNNSWPHWRLCLETKYFLPEARLVAGINADHMVSPRARKRSGSNSFDRAWPKLPIFQSVKIKSKFETVIILAIFFNPRATFLEVTTVDPDLLQLIN